MCELCGPEPALSTIDHSIKHPFELKPDTDNDCLECGGHLSRHPDKFEYLRRRRDEVIAEHGHQVQIVFPTTQEGTPFAYSIGRTAKGRPELLVTGLLHPDDLGYIVNEVAGIDDEKPLEVGDLLDKVLAGYDVKIVQVRDLREAGMTGVINRFDGASALQILWPDEKGIFPDDADYDNATQPVFA